jgi:hypothetical protein
MRFAVRSSLQAKAMRVAIVENAVVLAVALRELVEVLADQEGTDGVTGLEGERRFEEVEPAQCRELVEHRQRVAAFDTTEALG